jgi:hypothetical protein
MAKKSDRVRRREQKKADKAIKNANRSRPKRLRTEEPKDALSFPESHIITLDDLTKPKN